MARYETRVADVLEDKTLIEKQVVKSQRIPKEMPEGLSSGRK